MTTPLIGRVYVRRDNWMTGYWMVMSKGVKTVTLSPLFWADDVVKVKIDRETFRSGYRRFDPRTLSREIRVKYQREERRRLRIINENK